MGVEAKPAFMIAGTQSGCGKTTIALGLMAALSARGLRVQPFKTGPDFIDPGFHTVVSGRSSRNLDGWMLGAEYNRALFYRLLGEADVAIVEGAMGLFDGYDGTSETGSSAEMAKWLNLPVVLVVDARSMARSAAALVYGFSRFDPKLCLAGVLFNKIGGAGHLEYLKEAMAVHLPEIPVLGGIPRDEPIGLAERHLGLVTADETPLDAPWRSRIIDLVERHVNLDLLLKATERTFAEPPRTLDRLPSAQEVPIRARIAVARDAAFCFYYTDNLELLERAGAELHYFSPLAGETFPDASDGLYLGGGYPELFAEALAGRHDFLDALRRAFSLGMPIHAECGGLMVLSRFIETREGRRYSMAGLLPFGTRMLPRRKALGYTEVLLRVPCLLGETGVTLRGHEFHYSEIVEAAEDASWEKAYQLRKRKYEATRLEGYQKGSLLASYIHLHWGSAPEAPENFVKHCAAYRKTRGLKNGFQTSHSEHFPD